MHFFLMSATHLPIVRKNMLNKPSDFAIFGAFEIDETSVQWGIGMEWTDDITLLFLNYIRHKLYRIFGPKAIE